MPSPPTVSQQLEQWPQLEQWIAQFRGPLVGLLASWGADWHSAEELAMDTFAEAWLGRSRLRASHADIDAIGAWLRGIAQNLLRSHRRKLTRLPAQPAPESISRMAAPDEHDATQQPDPRLDVLRHAFPQLRLEHQEVLRMHYLEATTAREVAALLGVSQKTVEMRLYQARRALRHFADRHLGTSGVPQ